MATPKTPGQTVELAHSLPASLRRLPLSSAATIVSALGRRAGLWRKESQATTAARDESIRLPGYRVVIDAKLRCRPGGGRNLDLAYNLATRTLFTVTASGRCWWVAHRRRVAQRIPPSKSRKARCWENGKAAGGTDERRNTRPSSMSTRTAELE